MITAYFTAHNAEPQALEQFSSLENAIDCIRQHWNEEEEGSQMFWFRDDTGAILATMMRRSFDPETAITTYADGHIEMHRCVYVLDADGHYKRTSVVRLDRAPFCEGCARGKCHVHTD